MSRRGAVSVLSLAVTLYAVAAWSVNPGFFDGGAPPELYRFVAPPSGVTNNPQPPQAGSVTLKVAGNGQVDPGDAVTGESQFQAGLSVRAAAFQVMPGAATVTVEITPIAGAALPDAQTCTTNVYRFASTAPLVKEALVTLRFTDALPAPSAIFRSDSSSGPWISIGSTGSSSPYYLAARTTALGYFVACYPSNARAAAPATTLGGGQALPIVVAGAIVLVLLGGIPIALMRRRRDPDDVPPPGQDQEGD